MIMSFDMPHTVGSICAPPCKQCGEFGTEVGYVTQEDPSIHLPPQPMYILRKATYQEWRDWCIQTGAKGTFGDQYEYYYEVSTD